MIDESFGLLLVLLLYIAPSYYLPHDACKSSWESVLVFCLWNKKKRKLDPVYMWKAATSAFLAGVCSNYIT